MRKQGYRIPRQWALQLPWGTSQQSIPIALSLSGEQIGWGPLWLGECAQCSQPPLASLMPQPERGKGCKFPQVSKLSSEDKAD